MTNEEKIRQIRVEKLRVLAGYGVWMDCVDIDTILREMAEWKDKQYPHWNKQEENDIYFAISDWELHNFVCIMKDSQVCTWTGIKDESADGHIETHLVPDKEQYTIDDIVYWTEITI